MLPRSFESVLDDFEGELLRLNALVNSSFGSLKI